MKELVKLSYIPNSRLTVKTLWLFRHCMQENMNVADVVVRYMAIENYFNKNDIGWKMYNNMQHIRVSNNSKIPKYRDDNGERFKKLIKSVIKNGYIYDYPIQINKDFYLFDGSHRLAIALYFDIEEVAVCFNEPMDFTPDYSLEWFIKYGCGEYVDIIRNKYIEILKNKCNKYKVYMGDIELDKDLADKFCTEKIINKKGIGSYYVLYDIYENKKVKFIRGKSIVKDYNYKQLKEYCKINKYRMEKV